MPSTAKHHEFRLIVRSSIEQNYVSSWRDLSFFFLLFFFDVGELKKILKQREGKRIWYERVEREIGRKRGDLCLLPGWAWRCRVADGRSQPWRRASHFVGWGGPPRRRPGSQARVINVWRTSVSCRAWRLPKTSQTISRCKRVSIKSLIEITFYQSPFEMNLISSCLVPLKLFCFFVINPFTVDDWAQRLYN